MVAGFAKFVKIAELMETYYGPQLEKLGLSRKQIQDQSLKDLRQSLRRVDEAIENQESFESARIRETEDGNVVLSTTEEGSEVRIGLVLFRMKGQILTRIQQLESAEEVGELRQLIVKHVQDPARSEIIEKIEEAERSAYERHEKAREVEEAQVKEKSKVEAEVMLMEAEGKRFERRAKTWQTLLGRESVATVVGAIILILMSIALLIAMFTGIETSEIVGNAFLVILGYFFGQAVGRRASEE